MSLTGESYFAKKDPILGESSGGAVTGAIGAAERARLLAIGHTLGDVTRYYGAGVPLPELKTEAKAPASAAARTEATQDAYATEMYAAYQADLSDERRAAEAQPAGATEASIGVVAVAAEADSVAPVIPIDAYRAA